MPFTMDIDFDAVIQALKDIHYSGWFTMEAINYLKTFDADTVLTGVQDMAKVARKLVAMWEA